MKKVHLPQLLLVILSIITLDSFGNEISIDGITYRIENGEASVFQVNLSGSISFPASVVYSGVSYPVTSIYGNGFINGDGITKVTIPPTIKKIGERAFSDCKNLQDFVIEDSNVSLTIYPEVCNAKKLYIGRNVCGSGRISNEKYRGAFGSNLEEVRFGNDVTAIMSYVFYGNANLKNIVFPKDLSEIGDCSFYECINLGNFTLPSHLKTIGDLCFYNCYNISEITIPHSLEEIGRGIFTECRNLKIINFEDSSNKLKKGHNVPALFNIFSGLELERVYIGRDLDSQVDFASCTLEFLIIGKNVNEINPIFTKCQYVKNVTIEDGNKSLRINHQFVPNRGVEKVYLGRDLETIDNTVFGVDVNSIIIGPKVLTISSGVFSGCQELEELEIPEGVRYVNRNSFYGCSSLKTISFPSTLERVEYGCFMGCQRLEKITCYADTPPINASVNCFDTYTYDNTPLYVPVGAKELYENDQLAKMWSKFKNIIEMGGTSIDKREYELTIDKTYFLNGSKSRIGTKGIQIIIMSDGSIKKAFVK